MFMAWERASATDGLGSSSSIRGEGPGGWPGWCLGARLLQGLLRELQRRYKEVDQQSSAAAS